MPELKDAIRRKLCEFNGLDYGDGEVMVTTGSSGAFTAAALALFEPGDEIVLFEPFYSYHRSALTLLGCRTVSVALHGPEHHLDIAALKGAIGARTRAVVINTPGNPSGKVFSAAELREIARVLEGTRVLVLTDEVYEYMCFDGRPHVSQQPSPGSATGR